jgi:heme-degrading monooxygenase HmoA
VYLIQEILRVNSGRQSEAVKRLNWIHGLMQPNPGFAGAQVARNLGNLTDYLILRRWDGAEAFQAFRRTPDGQGYSKNRPEGLYEGVPVGRAWDLVLDSPGSGSGNFLVRSIYKVAEGRDGEFLESRRLHDSLALPFPGTISLQTFRCLDDNDEHRDTYLFLTRRTDRDAHNAVLESEAAAKYRASIPQGLFRGLSTECYEIVDEVLP